MNRAESTGRFIRAWVAFMVVWSAFFGYRYYSAEQARKESEKVLAESEQGQTLSEMLKIDPERELGTQKYSQSTIDTESNQKELARIASQKEYDYLLNGLAMGTIAIWLTFFVIHGIEKKPSSESPS